MNDVCDWKLMGELTHRAAVMAIGRALVSAVLSARTGLWKRKHKTSGDQRDSSVFQALTMFHFPPEIARGPLMTNTLLKQGFCLRHRSNEEEVAL